MIEASPKLRGGRTLATVAALEASTSVVEAGVLHDIRSPDVARAAFWAALRSAPPDEPVTLDDLVRTVALNGDDGTGLALLDR